MSTLDVVAEVLREAAPRALRAKEIADLAGSRLPTTSRTPETVVSRDLAIDVKDRGASSRFLRVGRGEFVLKEALPTAFYSDNDAHAAAWTRNLIAAGEIAAGVVDERSIRDLQPADVASYRQFHAFSGIGVWSRALRDAGWPDDGHVWSGSCPCTPFSSAGRKRGFDDDRHLWPDWFRLIAACRPALVVGEQVASKDGLAWLDVVLSDLEDANYAVRSFDLCAAGFGAPHLRQRIYFVAVARERGREVIREARLHDRGQSWNDAARRRATDCGVPGAVPHATSVRPRDSQDAGADRGDAPAGTEAHDRRSAGDLEFERGRDADATVPVFDADGERREGEAPCDDEAGKRCACHGGSLDATGPLSDAERVVRDAGRIGGPHGRSSLELDRHGEADGAHELGDAGLARGWRDAGALPRAEGAGEGERIEAGDLADEPLATGAADGRALGAVEVEVVRGAVGPAGNGREGRFQPGDRIRIDGDPSWGGAVRGYWAESVEWIYCRPAPGHQDGCFRPAEPSTQPLVDERTPGMGRTRAARLRGYGNAIVLEQATKFVEEVIGSLADDARRLEPVVDEDVMRQSAFLAAAEGKSP